MSSVNQESVKSFLEKIAADQEFAALVTQTDDPEEVIKKAASKDISLTMDDVMASRDIINKVMQNPSDGELSEKDLENVAGGIMLDTVISAAGWVAAQAIKGAAYAIGWTIEKWKW